MAPAQTNAQCLLCWVPFLVTLLLLRQAFPLPWPAVRRRHHARWRSSCSSRRRAPPIQRRWRAAQVTCTEHWRQLQLNAARCPQGCQSPRRPPLGRTEPQRTRAGRLGQGGTERVGGRGRMGWRDQTLSREETRNSGACSGEGHGSAPYPSPPREIAPQQRSSCQLRQNCHCPATQTSGQMEARARISEVVMLWIRTLTDGGIIDG